MTKFTDDFPFETRAPQDTPKTRDCMICRNPFPSAWAGERVCKRCKGTNAWKNGGGARSFSKR